MFHIHPCLKKLSCSLSTKYGIAWQVSTSAACLFTFQILFMAFTHACLALRRISMNLKKKKKDVYRFGNPTTVVNFRGSRMVMKLQRFMLEGPWPCVNLFFCTHTLCMSYITERFLLVSFSGWSKQVFCENFYVFHKYFSFNNVTANWHLIRHDVWKM